MLCMYSRLERKTYQTHFRRRVRRMGAEESVSALRRLLFCFFQVRICGTNHAL